MLEMPSQRSEHDLPEVAGRTWAQRRQPPSRAFASTNGLAVKMHIHSRKAASQSTRGGWGQWEVQSGAEPRSTANPKALHRR